MRTRNFLALLTLFALVLTAASPAADIEQKPAKYPFHFIVYGDIRFTNPADVRGSDPTRRDLLVEKIVEDKPAFVAITGDLVMRGANLADWEIFENGTKPVRDAHIPMFPTIGNHELVGDPTASNYLKHFPELKDHRWYSAQFGNVYCFLMDSSQDAAGGEEWKWLEEGLKHLPKETRFVFFVMHHPPITQSSEKLPGGGHSARPQEQKLEDLIEKAHVDTGLPMFVLAGHVHNYERYEHNGVTYIVTGGGGATPYEIARKEGDVYKDPGPTYHFTRWTVDKNKLTFEMVKLEYENGKPNWIMKDTFQVQNKKGPKK